LVTVVTRVEELPSTCTWAIVAMKHPVRTQEPCGDEASHNDMKPAKLHSCDRIRAICRPLFFPLILQT
jgi:hypothetical protein